MYRKLDCIALRTVKYSDKNAILSAFSREEGRVSLLVPAGTGRAAARLRALMMPMGMFECVAEIRPARDILPVRDVRPITLPPIGDPLRSSLALFLADILGGVLREQAADPSLFQFLERAINLLGDVPSATNPHPLTAKALCNFHIWFLLRLTVPLGIEPDWSTYRPGSYFDLTGGIFRTLPPSHRNFLPQGESATGRLLSRLTPRNLGHLQLTRFERNTVLDRILLYFRTHFPSLGEPASLSVLRML